MGNCELTAHRVEMVAADRWLALGVLCLGVLMILLDTTIVNVALPSIRSDLGFLDAGLAWVVNACLLSVGGFLLLGGRLSDLYGHRRLFLIGLAVFTWPRWPAALPPRGRRWSSRGLCRGLAARSSPQSRCR
jgi:MFS family permease